MNNNYFIDFKNISKADTKKKQVSFVPAPWGSKFDGLIVSYKYLPEMLERVFNNCLVLEDEPNYKDREIAKYHIAIDYLRGYISLKEHEQKHKDDLGVRTSLYIAATHLRKIGLNPDKIVQDYEDEQEKSNIELYTTVLETGKRVILSRGVVLKAMRDNEPIDMMFLVLNEATDDVFSAEYHDCKKNEKYCVYFINEERNARQSLDMALMSKGEAFFAEFLEINELKKVGKDRTKRIFDKMVMCQDDDDDNDDCQCPKR